MGAFSLHAERADEMDVAREHRDLAYFDGREAGLNGLASALNPHQDGTIAYAEWNRGWRSGNDQRCAGHAKRTEAALKLAAEMRERAKKCTYTHGSCDCGGIGRCLDVC